MPHFTPKLVKIKTGKREFHVVEDQGKRSSSHRTRRIKRKRWFFCEMSRFSQSTYVPATVKLNYPVSVGHTVVSYRIVCKLFPNTGRKTSEKHLRSEGSEPRLNIRFS